ncbi:MAG: YigZ family protein [Sphingobacteriales bacterium]|nr:MAG: YigZ family protein [Sphingobacteriales bacterium]
MEAVSAFLDEVKSEHPKATHHCYAYRLGTDKELNYRSNDDGEPSGTAGKPILGQIDSKGLSNVMVIVVRYFGGTKLGVSGLIGAYKTSARMVLTESLIVEKEVEITFEIQFAYLNMNEVMSLVKRYPLKILYQSFDNQCQIKIRMAKGQSASLLKYLEELEEIEVLWKNP